MNRNHFESFSAQTFGPNQVSVVANIPRATLHSWMARRYLPLPPGPGMGKERQFTFLDLIAVTVVAELSRLGISVGIAAHAATLISRIMDDGKNVPLDEAGWVLVLAPTEWPLNDQGSHEHPIPLALIKPDSPDQMASFIQKQFSNPLTYAVVDFSAAVERVVERLALVAVAKPTKRRSRRSMIISDRQ